MKILIDVPKESLRISMDSLMMSQQIQRIPEAERILKQSGLGKEATLESMLEHFTHKKTIILNMT